MGTWLSSESIVIWVCTQHRKSWPPDVTIFLETFFFFFREWEEEHLSVPGVSRRGPFLGYCSAHSDFLTILGHHLVLLTALWKLTWASLFLQVDVKRKADFICVYPRELRGRGNTTDVFYEDPRVKSPFTACDPVGYFTTFRRGTQLFLVSKFQNPTAPRF